MHCLKSQDWARSGQWEQKISSVLDLLDTQLDPREPGKSQGCADGDPCGKAVCNTETQIRIFFSPPDFCASMLVHLESASLGLGSSHGSSRRRQAARRHRQAARRHVLCAPRVRQEVAQRRLRSVTFVSSCMLLPSGSSPRLAARRRR